MNPARRQIAGDKQYAGVSESQWDDKGPGFSCGVIGQKPALSLTLRLRSRGHILNPQILKHIQLALGVDHESMTGLMRILVMHMHLIVLIPSRLAIGFLLILGPLLAPGGPPLPFFPLSSGLLVPFIVHRLVHKLKIKGLPV